MKKQYFIPTNYMETGYVMNGAVSIRNAVEGGVLALLGYFLCSLLPLPEGVDGISYYILICGPFFLVGVAGIQGDPISVFVMNFCKWRKRQKPYFYSSHGEAYTQEAADVVMESPQLRDMVADLVVSLRGKFATEEVDYVEGKTFEFAEDPEQAALRQAQADLLAKRMKEAEKKVEELEILEFVEDPSAIPSENNLSVNAKQISEMIKLDELQWEEES